MEFSVSIGLRKLCCTGSHSDHGKVLWFVSSLCRRWGNYLLIFLAPLYHCWCHHCVNVYLLLVEWCGVQVWCWRCLMALRSESAPSGGVVCVVYEQGMTLCTVVIFVSLEVENIRMFLCWSKPLGHVNGAKWLDINKSQTLLYTKLHKTIVNTTQGKMVNCLSSACRRLRISTKRSTASKAQLQNSYHFYYGSEFVASEIWSSTSKLTCKHLPFFNMSYKENLN